MSDNQSKQAFWGYCVTTAILCLVMVGGGVSDLLKIDQMKEVMDTLGYPAYLMTILGVAKLLGAVAILVPGFARLKELGVRGFYVRPAGSVYIPRSSGRTNTTDHHPNCVFDRRDCVLGFTARFPETALQRTSGLIA
jgi:uncharacterized membrane protein YphA (DoxX/SURF4 family)